MSSLSLVSGRAVFYTYVKTLAFLLFLILIDEKCVNLYELPKLGFKKDKNLA